MDKPLPPNRQNSPRFSIINPFWAGFLHGFVGAWGGSMIVGLFSICAIEASYLTWSNIYTPLGVGLGLLAGVGFTIYIITDLRKKRLKSNLKQSSGFGLSCGIAFYFLICLLVLWYGFKEPATSESSRSFGLSTPLIPTTTITPKIVPTNTIANLQTMEETKNAIRSNLLTQTAEADHTPSVSSTPIFTSISMEVNVRGIELFFSAAQKSPYCFRSTGTIVPSSPGKICLIVFANIMYGSKSEIDAIKDWQVTLNHKIKFLYFKISGSETTRMAIWQFAINMNETSFIINLPDDINIDLRSLVT
jgi:hypothetical protein